MPYIINTHYVRSKLGVRRVSAIEPRPGPNAPITIDQPKRQTIKPKWCRQPIDAYELINRPIYLQCTCSMHVLCQIHSTLVHEI